MDSTLPISDHNDGDEELCTSSVGSASVANSDLRGELVRLSASLCVGKEASMSKIKCNQKVHPANLKRFSKCSALPQS